MPDSSAIDSALLAKLNDPQLLALMPNGVYWGIAAEKMTRFVVVALADHSDEYILGTRSHEDALYIVKAVGLSTTNPDMTGAAARIDALLDYQELAAAGYSGMVMRRERRIRDTERDDLDPTIRWFHRGGYYRVVMST